MPQSELQSCPHCSRSSDPAGVAHPYCCRGCRLAHRLLTERGLTRFYELADDVRPAVEGGPASAWLEPLLERARATADGAQLRLTLDVQGVHCAGCVWLIQALFDRRDGAVHLDLNPGLGRLVMTVDAVAFDAPAFVADLAAVGYPLGPPAKRREAVSDGLALRLGVTTAIALNSMILSAAGYFGLSAASDPGIHTLFGWLNLGLATLAVVIGGPVFFRGAAAAVARRILHLDVPIALGVLLAYVGSAALFLSGQPDAAYFDTLTAFIALMLVGRYVQRRWLERSRRLLLADTGLAELMIRRLEPDGTVAFTPLPTVTPGTRLLWTPGELLPVDAKLAADGPGAEVSLAWIDGESDPVPFAPGAVVPAGGHLVGRQAVAVAAVTGFAQSALHTLLDPGPAGAEARSDRLWHRVSAVYVAVVLVAAIAGLVAWWATSPARALEVAVAVLVITCPCALGLATPLANELAHVALRRRGLVVRRAGFLARARAVRTVVFDKTGTLTLAEPVLVDAGAVAQLEDTARDALYQLVVRSNHPKSRALLAVLERGFAGRLDLAANVDERAGRGLFMRRAGRDWALETRAEAADARLRLTVDGDAVATFAFREQLRPGAASGVAALRAAGRDVWLLSGDREERVAQVAAELGISADRAVARCSPQDKAARVAALDAAGATLMLGDGVNDALAFAAASVAGTPAVDRPTLPARADFYLMNHDLEPVADALLLAERVRRVIRGNLWFAALYNVAGVALALAGWLPPVVCAVAMPLSSIAVLSLTTARLARPWRNSRAAAPSACPLPAALPAPVAPGVTP